MTLIKSKKRVADHGEVFTPDWLVEAMLDLVKDETERLDSRFLEPACGSGNFLTKILKRKLAAVSGDKEAQKTRDVIAAKMTSQQIAKAQEMAKRCQASKYKDCD
jgi:type I restriction-modification system DNA methylase subunit